ncbi:MAG: PfkB family carbohydrate kinase [Caldilineaceae bacterium]
MIDYFTFSLIIDDLVLPDGRTYMGLLGGGGPQTAFGMKLWTSGSVGICAGVGSNFPPEAQKWLDAMAIDTAGVRLQPQYPTLRAWQILEEDGTRTQLWRTRGSVIPAHLAFAPDLIPPAYWGARGFHFGIHPEHPNLAAMQALRARGTAVSVEPFRAAERRLNDEELRTLLGSCDIFSPNVEEANSLVGSGTPEEQVARLAAAGAPIVALRMGAAGSLVYAAAAGTAEYIPAVPAAVVDQVGAGNAYCGGFLVGWLETGDLRLAGRYASVAASFLVEQYGLPRPRPDMQAEAAERLEALR